MYIYREWNWFGRAMTFNNFVYSQVPIAYSLNLRLDQSDQTKFGAIFYLKNILKNVISFNNSKNVIFYFHEKVKKEHNEFNKMICVFFHEFPFACLQFKQMQNVFFFLHKMLDSNKTSIKNIKKKKNKNCLITCKNSNQCLLIFKWLNNFIVFSFFAFNLNIFRRRHRKRVRL